MHQEMFLALSLSNMWTPKRTFAECECLAVSSAVWIVQLYLQATLSFQPLE